MEFISSFIYRHRIILYSIESELHHKAIRKVFSGLLSFECCFMDLNAEFIHIHSFMSFVLAALA